MKNYLASLVFLFSTFVLAQKNSYWQQKVDYKMEVEMDAKTYQYKGKQELKYTNNSN